jgi:ubiquinone/menaquinone biosynthesis C-methylase UbiE
MQTYREIKQFWKFPHSGDLLKIRLLPLMIILLYFLSNSHCSDSYMARHFNETAQDPDNKPEFIINALAIKKGDKIADLGAGGGFFSFKFSESVGQSGTIYAVDINKNYLKFIDNEIKVRNIANIKTVLASGDDSNLPEQRIDLIFLRNVYHHLPDRIKYFQKLGNTLVKDGKIAIIEYNKNLNFIEKFHGHYTDRTTIINEMQQAGYGVFKSIDFLEKQSFIIFIIKKNE